MLQPYSRRIEECEVKVKWLGNSGADTHAHGV